MTGKDGTGCGLKYIIYTKEGEKVEEDTVKKGEQLIINMEGEYRLEYWGVDKVDNEESKHHEVKSMKLDKIAPEALSKEPDDNATSVSVILGR